MLLSRDDAELFFSLHRTLMHFVNQRLDVVSDVGSPDEFSALPPEKRLDVRKAFLDRLDLIESFVDENPSKLSDDELSIVLSWRHQVSGTFYVFRQLKNHMVFLASGEPPVAYGPTPRLQTPSIVACRRSKIFASDLSAKDST